MILSGGEKLKYSHNQFTYDGLIFYPNETNEKVEKRFKFDEA